MRMNERKGAWTLLICILLFGALVWGLGNRKMRENAAEQQTEQEILFSPGDSVSDTVANSGKNKRECSAAKSPRAVKTNEIHVRDILADTIPPLRENNRQYMPR